ncbi:MAG: type I-E CRISPR-associated protein Cse1/CasA [Desulfitobacteriia bacterium]
MIEKEFNLLYEPWILVMKPNGETEEVSLMELFQGASKWQGLAGELPTQDVAVLRLLLAILHAVFARYDPDGNYAPITSPTEALSRWKGIWDKGEFPMEIIGDYLKHYEDRFYLFHSERPFYQVAGLEKHKKAAKYTAAKLNGIICQSGSEPFKPQKARLFPQRTGDSLWTLRYSEAARWLLHINAFDDVSGSGKGRGEKKRSKYELGWLGKLGLIAAIGGNLFETLLLNLIFLKDENELWGKEEPIWEVETVKTDEGVEITIPDNPSGLLTIQSRRLLLERQNGLVIGYYLLGGDYFTEENAYNEQMTLWLDISKKDEQPKHVPRRHDSARQIWRDFSVLVGQSEGGRPPGIIKWLSKLKSNNAIEKKHFRFQTAAVRYDSKNCSIEDVFSDTLSFNAALLTKLGEDWVSNIIDELKITSRLVEEVGFLARNLAKASGDSDGSSESRIAREQAYFRLDEPFRQWLAEIDPKQDSMNETCLRWWEKAQGIVRGFGRELLDQAGPSAFVGHNGYIGPRVYNYFLSRTSNREILARKE